MEIIKSIEIRKFRSIKSLVRNLTPTNLNIFVGQNDKGKSNILRALNLFFNNNTDAGQPFRFDDDYCYHANTGTGTRKEIRIDLIIEPPKNRFKHAKPVRWTKRWRRDGSVLEDKIYIKNGEKLSSKNNVSKWLDKLRYRYVPAIKGPGYFTRLMGQLHDVLNESHGAILSAQGEGFIQGIQGVTEKITSELEQQIGIASTIQVPSDFRLLFSNLDFGSRLNGDTYHLKQRGDGVKVRHIPVVLKYMSEQEKNISIPGYVKPDTIWGFEEPENNLEIGYAFELAEKFKIYSQDIQIFLTTHSPAFYSLDKTDTDGVNAYLVEQNEECCTEIKKIAHSDSDEIHEKMGFLQLITPYLSEINEQQQKIEILTKEIDAYSDEIVCVVLTEDTNHSAVSNYFDINGFIIEQTEFISYDGANQINAAILLGNYIKKKRPNVEIIIHRDRDYLTNENIIALKRKVEKHGHHFFVTDGVDIEGQFLVPEHINALFEIISFEQAVQFIKDATDSVEADSIGRLIDQFFKTEKPENNGYARKIRELNEQYANNKVRYRYGKKVCANLRSRLQRRVGENINLYQESEFIYSQHLLDIVDLIWL